MTDTQAQLIVLANQKGGVGKTTTAITLAHGMALSGLRVLLMDLDPQGNVAVSLGLNPQPGLSHLIRDQKSPDEVIIRDVRPNLDLLPGDASTEHASQYVVLMPRRRDYVLLDRLGPVLARYDAVLIDCAPSRNILHQSAMAVADWLLLPTQLNTLDIYGVNLIVKLARELRTDIPGCHILLAGILPTFFERRTNETAAMYRYLKQHFPEHTWEPIPSDVKAREATSFGKTVLEYTPESPVVAGYPAQTNGTIRRVGGYRYALGRMLSIMNGRRQYGEEKTG